VQWEDASATPVQANRVRKIALSSSGVGGWVSRPYTVALPGNADLLGAVRQLQGSSLRSSRAVAGTGGWNGRVPAQP
jgi:hypothetical protein